MSLYQGLVRLTAKLFGGRGSPSPAKSWLSRRGKAAVEEVIHEHFRAINAHDLEWILATLAPERGRLYNDPRTLDRKRLTVLSAEVVSVEPCTAEQVPMPSLVDRYRAAAVFKVTTVYQLVPPEERRDPTLRDGTGWAYYVLVSEGPGKGWMIADWGV